MKSMLVHGDKYEDIEIYRMTIFHSYCNVSIAIMLYKYLQDVIIRLNWS